MHQNPFPQSDLDLSGLIRGWKTILLTTVAAMVTGGILLVTITPLQKVKAKVIVEPRDVTFDGRPGAARDKEFLPTHAEILQSPAVIEEALRRLESIPDEQNLTAQVLAVVENLKIDPLAGTSILLMRYSDVDQVAAASVVNALIDSYTEYLNVSEKQQHQELLVALTDRDREFQENLTRLQDELEHLKRANIDTAGADPVATARIVAGLEESLATTQSRRILLEHSVARMRSPTLLTRVDMDSHRTDTGNEPSQFNSATILSELVSLSGEEWLAIPPPTVAMERLTQAQERLNTLSQTLGRQHPELQAAQSAVTTAQAEVQNLVSTAPELIARTLESLQMQERALQSRYDNHVRLTNATEVARLKESQKLAEIQRIQESFDTVHSQLQQWQLVDQAMANGRAGVKVSVLEPPTPGERSFVANPLIVMGVSGLLGLMFGIFVVIAIPQARRLVSQSTLQPGISSPAS